MHHPLGRQIGFFSSGPWISASGTFQGAGADLRFMRLPSYPL